jgi:heterodisulfide reductase subunit C
MIQQANSVSPSAQRGLDFTARIAEASGQPVATCYQCQKCTSWCPVTEFMDLKPHQLVRLIQLGLTDRVYDSRSVWLCVGCAGCGATCPNDIDFHHLADALQQAADADARSHAGALTAFDKAFLATVRKKGRASELGLVMRFKLATGRLLADTKLGLWMMLHGKLKLFGEKVRQRREIREMFDRADKRKEARR